MKTKLTNRPVEQVMAAIRALDLEPIKLRVMDPELGEGWTREYAESIERAYRNYLTMLVKHPEDAEDIVVSKDVDEFWHTHILHTMKYTEDCEKVFGTYLHHSPEVGERTQALLKKAVLAEKTRRLYQREFGNRQDYNAAWSGIFAKAENAAMSSAAVRMENAAMSSAAIRVENAAMSSAAIRMENAAMSSAAIRMENAAMSSAAIRAENVDWSPVSPENEPVVSRAAPRSLNGSARAIPVAA